MGKHVKLGAKQVPATADAGLDALDLAEQSLNQALKLANDMVTAGDAPVQLLRAIDGLSGKLTAVSAERRARDKARVHTARTIPREVVVAYVRELSEEERARFVMEVSAMAEGSVMG